MTLSEQERSEIVRRVVRQVARRVVPDAPHAPSAAPAARPAAAAAGPAIGWTSAESRPLVTADALREVAPGATFRFPRGATVTPLARDVAADRRIVLVEEAPAAGAETETRRGPAVPPGARVAVGADHAGFRTKEALRFHLRARGYEVRDFGTGSEAAVDYPDFARAVAEAVARGECAVGIVADGAGVGAGIAANKVPGVRAAPCADAATARNAREHNFANVLCLPARALGEAAAREIVDAFLETPTGGERHARRVGKILDIERTYARGGSPAPDAR